MKYPDAARGIKKIFTAEILKLIAYVCLIVASIIFVIALAADSTLGGNTSEVLFVGGGIGALILGAASIVLLTISFIMNLVGYINASHEDDSFKTALVFLILKIIMVCLFGFFSYRQSGIGNMFYSLATLSETIASIFVIAGGVKLADRLNRGDVSKTGANVLKLMIAVAALSFIASFIATFLGGVVVSVTAAVLVLVAFVLSVIKYIMYLSFLAKAKKMLQEN